MDKSFFSKLKNHLFRKTVSQEITDDSQIESFEENNKNLVQVLQTEGTEPSKSKIRFINQIRAWYKSKFQWTKWIKPHPTIGFYLSPGKGLAKMTRFLMQRHQKALRYKNATLKQWTFQQIWLTKQTYLMKDEWVQGN